MEAVGNATLCGKVDHSFHHIARTREAETDVLCAFEHEGSGFHKVFGAFLHSDASEEGDHLLFALVVRFALRHDGLNVFGQRIDSIVHSDALRRVLMVVIDDRLSREFRHAHDAVSVVHTVFLNGIDGGVHLSARTVEVSGVHVNHQGTSAHLFGVDAGRIGEPVVGMDNVVLLLSGNDASHDGIVVDFFLQVVGIFSRKLDAAQIVGLAIGEVSIDVVAQGIVLFRCHARAEAFFDVVVVHISPNDGCFAQADDVHKTLIFVAPRFRNAEGDVHIGLLRHASCDAVGRSAKSAEDVGRKFPTKH